MAHARGATPKTWIVVGASRGIGKEFVDQLVARGDKVIATVRGDTGSFWPEKRDQVTVLNCDVTVEKTINTFAEQVSQLSGLTHIDYAIINAGILGYPNRATECSFSDFSLHLTTNCVGPIYVAQKLLQCKISIHTLVFISSDSGSSQEFREMEDGFAAYAASKAALNMAARHMAAELTRKGSKTLVLCLHPGEVKTDMADIELDWEIDDEMTPEVSVRQCISTIESKGLEDSGTCWKWDGRVQAW